MARLLMVSKDMSGGDAVSKILNPRTGVGIGKFRVKQVIAWNMNGINDTFRFSTISPNYGAFELYNSGNSTPTAVDLMMRIPISSKSRINLTIPQSGVTFENGIWMKVGAESSNNNSQRIYLQIVGYELG